MRSALVAIVTLVAVLLIAALFEFGLASRHRTAGADDFADAVELGPLHHIAVHTTGRLKALDSHTADIMNLVTGPHRLDGRDATFTYFDMLLRSDRYTELDSIYIHKELVRERLAMALIDAAAPHEREGLFDWVESFRETGLISPRRLTHPAIARVLGEMNQDLIKTAKFVREIEIAFSLSRPELLIENLRIVPPGRGDAATPWLTPQEYLGLRPSGDAIVDPQQQLDVALAWADFSEGWAEADTERVNEGARALAEVLPRINPGLYPDTQRHGWPWSIDAETRAGWIASASVLAAALGVLVLGIRRASTRLIGLGSFLGITLLAMHAGALLIGRINPLELEAFYFRNYFRVNEVWILYLFSVVFLLMGVVYRWKWARVSGLTIFLLAFALHSAALLLRWYVADRWPNSNMFEAVTTAAWFGGCGAVVLEALVRKTAMRNLFALGSAAASMTAFMAAHFLPQALNAGITNKMPVLNDIWLYIHTNVIIFSYVLIFMAFMVAVLYLFNRWLRDILNLTIPCQVAGALLGGLVLTALLRSVTDLPAAMTPVALAIGIVVSFVLLFSLSRHRFGDRLGERGYRFAGVDDYARVGGAGSLVMTGPDGTAWVTSQRTSFGQILDGATMILVELSFILLWAGIVMGAIWADHSWGRPWGWDPKEVFALNTFLVFAVLIHTRLKVRDKGLWTAVLTIIGCVVMLFNWIFINFKISGLHSYA